MSRDHKYKLLSTISSPDDLKRLDISDLDSLAAELRTFIIETVSKTGGHLGGNLGAVELITALHYVYDAPRDQFVWDVGAQAYAHKILTGRMNRFDTLRQFRGVAPFPKREESEYDTFGVGHSSTSISAALGMAMARDHAGDDQKIIAIIGDGGMTGGLAFEGLNNAGISNRDITVVLNDNSMSISPNVGALSQHLSSIRADPRFEKLKDSMWQLAGRLPEGSKLRKALHGVDSGIRAMLIPGLWFERLGFRYVGPVDGHNIAELVKMFSWLKGISGPVVIHVLTKKGKGYRFAEEDRLRLHSISRMDPDIGPVKSKKPLDFSAVFSDELTKIAIEDAKVVAITPAMIEGSKLAEFQKMFPDRCYDVGIAEQHAVTFAAGLATQGIRPVVAVYSTFLQRAYDQVVHDIALQKLPVIFGVDRAGLVGEDGPTHHGSFDISYLRHIPNMTLFAARDEKQLRLMLRAAHEYTGGPVAIRFPRGTPPKSNYPDAIYQDVWKPVYLRNVVKNGAGLVLGVGPLILTCVEAADELANEEGLDIAVLDLQCLKPLNVGFLTLAAKQFSSWISVEENALLGGLGSGLLEFISDQDLAVRLVRVGIPDRFITHGDQESLLKEVGLDKESLKETMRRTFGRRTGLISRLRTRTVSVGASK